MTPARIKKLSPLIISQIAAGEVIDRPAAIVKELLENAIDAGAQHISIKVWQGGMSRIEVTDNGRGILADDMLLSVQRHATSKLTSDDVLSGVNTLGFRGEALASIAAVARLEIKSSADNSGIGRSLQIEGTTINETDLTPANTQPAGNPNAHSTNAHSQTEIHFERNNHQSTNLPELKPITMPRGTQVRVQDLFFNVPARRRFLKSIATEFGHIENIVKRLALNYFHIGFELWHQDQLRFSVKPASSPAMQKQRLAVLLDARFAQQAQPLKATFDDEKNQGSLTGWLGFNHHINQKTEKKLPAKYQYWFINGRLVQNNALKKLVQHCITQSVKTYCQQPDLLNHSALLPQHTAYEISEASCISTLTDAALDYVLFLNVPEHTVNVNIHPTKLDVRLENEQQIFTLIGYFLQKQLNSIIATFAPDALQQASLSEQQTRLDLGKALFWNQHQLISQTNTGLLLINTQNDLAANTPAQVASLLATWQQQGKPKDIEVKEVSFETLLALLAQSPE